MDRLHLARRHWLHSHILILIPSPIRLWE